MPFFRNAGQKLKKAVGIEGSAKEALLPMLSYNVEHFSSAGASYIFGLYYMPFLTYVEKLGPGQAGLVMFFKSVWDAVIDPFLGLLTDRTRSRLGRHRIYIILGAVPFGLTFFMLWNSFGLSAAGNSSRLMLYYLIANILFTGSASLIAVPHTAMLPELAPGYFQRTQYVSMGYIFNSMGMVPSYLLVSAFIGLVKTKEFTPAMRPTFTTLALVLGVAYIFPILLCGVATKEKSSLHMNPPKADGAFILNEYRMVFQNRAFVQYFVMSFLLMFGTAFFAASKQYFIYEVAGAPEKLNALVGLAGIAEASAFPLNFALTKKFGKQRMAWFTVPFLLLSLSLSFVIGKNVGGRHISWMTILLFAQEMLYPFGSSGIGFAIQNIFPDVTDVDELMTGRRREGVIATFSAFIKTTTGGLLQFLTGVLLEWFGVSANKAGETSNVLFRARAASVFGQKLGGPTAGLRFVHGFLPLAFTLAALLSLRRYTMTREEHKLIRDTIARAHAGEDLGLSEGQKARLSELAGRDWRSMWVAAPPPSPFADGSDSARLQQP